MSATQHGTAATVIDQLFDHPQRFQFFQALNLILLHLKEHGVAADKALIDHLRFSNSISLAFPASDIESLRVEEGVVAASGAASARPLPCVRMTPTFMGYLGAHGALPNHYSVSIAERQHEQKDEGARAFLDIFQTRIVALFYEAWRKYRIEYAISAERDQFLPLLLALCGLRPAAAADFADSADSADPADPADPGGIADETFGFYSCLLQQRPVSPSILARVLSDYFGVPIAVTEAVGYWEELAPHERWTQGAPGMVLGELTVLGARMWRPDLRVRLTIGPLTRAEFDGFAPHTARARAVKRLLTLFASPTLSYQIALVLRAQDVQAIELSGPLHAAPRIGYGSFLMTKPNTTDRVALSYIVRTLDQMS